MHKQVKDANDAVVSEAFHLRDASGRELGVQETEGAGENATSAWTWYAFGGQRFAKATPLQQPDPNAAQGGGEPFTYTNAYGTNALKHVGFYLQDHLGNTRVAYKAGCDGAGATRSLALEHVADYYPYGSILREYVESRAERYLTTLHERDQETGLDYRGARYYDSEVGRFLSVDPVLKEYFGWSSYNYVLGNPVSLIDLDGRCPTCPQGKEALDIYEQGAIVENNQGKWQFDNGNWIDLNGAKLGSNNGMGSGSPASIASANLHSGSSGLWDNPIVRAITGDAIAVSLNFDLMMGTGGTGTPIQLILPLRGEHAWEPSFYGDVGYGLGIDVSAGLTFGRLWVLGNTGEITPEAFEGPRMSAEIGANLPVASIGIEYGGFYAPPPRGAGHAGVLGEVGGITISPGGFPPISGNYNYGTTIRY